MARSTSNSSKVGKAPIRDPNTQGEIQIKVYGETCIKFNSSDAKSIGAEELLIYYDGIVEYGISNCSVNAIVLAFDSCNCDGESDVSAADLCDNLSSVSSSYVMNVLAYGEGTGDKSSWVYLAFPLFQQTFASFIEKESQMTAENGRFTQVFAKLTGDVAKGFENLHARGYCCPSFDGTHVAVICEDGHLSAKIWNFCLAGSEADKSEDWPRLANKIKEAAVNHKILSLEINDLCEKMSSGQLTGLKIPKHSALLSASVKLDKVVALNQYVQTYCRDQQSQHPYMNDVKKSQIHNDLLKFLDDSSIWCPRDTPQWVLNINNTRGVKGTIDNGESFIFELRSMREHENFYAHPTAEKDLEEQIRESWEEEFLQILNFATDLELRYE